MRIVHAEGELAGAFKGAQSEARSAFGDGRIYVEKYLDRPRHIEFQILADRSGNTVHLGERECSIQRRHQKVIEETPSTAMTDDLRSRMGETAVRAANSCNYENAGTVEFLLDGDRNFYFLEMNTRLQVEHPVTEMRTGIDLVAQQLAIAEGKSLPFQQNDIRFQGHSIECRICAEDPENAYMPSTGTITHLRPSQGIGIREDRGIEAGNDVSVYYDPMISKLVVWAPTREHAIHRMLRALGEYELVGVTTNIPLCAFVLQHPKFVAGDFDTHFLAREFDSVKLRENGRLDRKAAALLCAFIQDSRVDVRAEAKDPTHREQRGWKLKRNETMRS
jgi:acetyl-CoA carboxylase biotin carboxylase subunit